MGNAADYLTTALARNEPAILDQDMTMADIVAALERLEFHGDFRVIKVDGAVRDNLVSALRRRI